MRLPPCSINVTLDGSCRHEAGLRPDEESMRRWTARMTEADALADGCALTTTQHGHVPAGA